MTAAKALVVRRARREDLGHVAPIENASFSDPWPANSLLSELEVDQRRRPLIAERDGEIVGYLMAWIAADEYHIVNIAVSPSERRAGVGTVLLEAGLDEARRDGCRLATLEVRLSNRTARMFYERHAFHHVGTRPRYYSDNGEDALILSRLLFTEDDLI